MNGESEQFLQIIQKMLRREAPAPLVNEEAVSHTKRETGGWIDGSYCTRYKEPQDPERERHRRCHSPVRGRVCIFINDSFYLHNPLRSAIATMSSRIAVSETMSLAKYA